MSQYQDDSSFSQHLRPLSLLFSTEKEDVEAAGRPRRFPLCRGMRSDDSFAVQALTYEAGVEESQETMERAVYGVMEEESDAAQVLVDMAKQEGTAYDWSVDSPLPSDIDAYIAEHPFTPCSPLPPSRLSLTTSSFLYGSQLDQQIASTWADQSRAPPFTPLPAWATCSPSNQYDHKSDALDQLFSEYFDFTQLGEYENTCGTDGADQHTYDRDEFFESYTTPSPSPPVLAAQLEESTPHLLPPDLTQGLYIPASPASALYGLAYAHPGFDSQRWQHRDQYQTPALSTPALTFDTGSTAYSTLPPSTPLSSSNAMQLPPYRVGAPVAGKRDLPFPPAFIGPDLDDDPFYIGGASRDSSGVGKTRATDRIPAYPSVVLGVEKGKGQGRAKATSLSPTTQIRNAIVHPSLATPILSYTPLQSSASPAPAASGAFSGTVEMSQVYGQSGSLEIQLHDPSFDYKSTFLAPADVSTSCASRPSGTIDPKQTSSPVGSQPFRPSPSFGSFPLLQTWPMQMQDDPKGRKREVKRTGPFMRRNLALEAAERVDKVIVLDGQQSPPVQSAAQPATAAKAAVSTDQAAVSANPAASNKGKGKGKSSDKVRRVTETVTKRQLPPSKLKSRADLTVEVASRSSRERGHTPTLHRSEFSEEIEADGWTVDEKRGILESVSANLSPTSHGPLIPLTMASVTAHSANSMTFLSPDSTPTRAEKLALRQQTRRIAELSAPLFPSPRTRRRYDDDSIRTSSPVPDLDDLDLSDTDIEEPVRKRRKGEGQKGAQEQHVKKGEGHGEEEMKRRKILGVRSGGGQGMGKNAGAGWVGFTSSEMLTSLEDVSAPAGPLTKTPVIRAQGVKRVDKKNKFKSPAPNRAHTSAASIAGDGIGDQLPEHGQPAPVQGGSGSSYHKGPVEGLRRIRSRTSASFIPPTPVRQSCGRADVASSIPVMPDGNAKTGPMPAGISNEAGTLKSGTSANVAAAPPTPESRPTKRKRASTTIPTPKGASLRPDSSSMSKQAEAAAPAPGLTGMASPPSSPFSRPLTFSRSPSDRSLTAENEQGSDGDLMDADAEEEDDEVQEASSEEQEQTEDEYQDAAEKKTSKIARNKRKAKAKASGYKQPPRKGSGNQAVKKVEAGGGSTQAHTGRGYTEHELQLMLPFWDGKSVLSIGALKGAQKALTKAGYKKREPTALKWYMKNTLHARILKYAEENPPAVPLPPSTRTRSGI